MAYKAYRRKANIDIESGGSATISGVVREQTTPVAGRTVFLIRQGDMRVCRRTMSGADGTYSFAAIAAATEWMVLAIDPNATYNAVVADRVQT